MIRCENSEVLPAGSVAVAEIRAPASVDDRKRHVDRGVARAVGRDLRRAEVGLALENSRGKLRAGGVRVEVEVEGRRGRAVELALDRACSRALRPRCSTDWRIGKFWQVVRRPCRRRGVVRRRRRRRRDRCRGRCRGSSCRASCGARPAPTRCPGRGCRRCGSRPARPAGGADDVGRGPGRPQLDPVTAVRERRDRRSRRRRRRCPGPSCLRRTGPCRSSCPRRGCPRPRRSRR